MRNIIIVECVSTGINFIQDIINRNYNPIVLQTKNEEGEANQAYEKLLKDSYKKIEADFELIYEKGSYEETLDMVMKYDPLLVIAGSEKGVILATKLANDLSLKCNPIENLDAMTLKDKMQERIAEKGLRHIRGKVIHSIEEAIDYYDECGFKEVVVKPVYSAGSVGVRICLNKEDMINSLEELFNEVNIYGDEVNEFVIQERIDGDEYIVNTVSCNGVHRITLMWKYTKRKTNEGGQIYDYQVTVNELGLGEADLVEYAYDVVNAIGIKYGPIHGEYMIDENGPVLIEVNCRPCGLNMSAKYIDRISGQHETDSALDSYLNPEKFNYEKNKGYTLYEHGAIKTIVVPKDITAESAPMAEISNRLKSHRETSMDIIEQAQFFTKTQDLETTGGTIYLAHEDPYILQKDLDFLCGVEKYAFQLVLSNREEKKTSLDEDESYNDLKSILNKIHAYGLTLFVTDEIFDEVDLMQVLPEEIRDVKGDFDCIVVNLNKSITNKKDDEVANLLLNIIDRVKVGGFIFIPQSTYQYLPNGRIGAEALIKVLGLKLELPLLDFKKVAIASKRL
ncbi:ATP-grasp domain-containing protein [Methanobrevibacter sp.]|uniref:ATP-grasp domain-containing protein n=1 Tax=Methanobrevibacter sp. TaxID=66852 RepID=UPI00388EA44E